MTFRVALTFDAEHPDRPHRAGGTERVLDMLAADGRQGHVLPAGSLGRGVPELARVVADARPPRREPLLLPCADAAAVSPPGIATDIRAAERAISAATGVDPRPWFRCPFGAGTTIRGVLARHRAPRLSRDPLGRGRRRLAARADAVRGDGRARSSRTTVARGDGAVVLLHPWTTATGLGLAALIAGLRDAGRRRSCGWTRWA